MFEDNASLDSLSIIREPAEMNRVEGFHNFINYVKITTNLEPLQLIEINVFKFDGSFLV